VRAERTASGPALPFPLLDGRAPGSPAFVRPPRPLESERLAWRNADAARRLLERRARAARRERGAFGPATEALFDLVARSEMLPVIVPGGRLPKDFAARCLRAARARAQVLEIEKAALEAGSRNRDRFEALTARRFEGLTARRFEGLTARRFEGLTARRVEGSAVRRFEGLTARRLARLAARYPGDPEEGLAPGELAVPGTRWLVDRRGTLRARAVIPGTAIVVGPPLRSDRTRLRAVRDRPGAERSARRLGRALALLDAAWPEAGAEARRRTRLVLPLAEPGLVSFSLPARPGVSFINLRGKSIVDLADDLLHETAHHRLHAIERRRRLVPASALEEGAPRFWSPWRRAPRPARGILHAAYTFAFRAELLTRVAAVTAGLGASGSASPRRVAALAPGLLRAEAARERRRLRAALEDLRRAARMGLLTAEGTRLLAPLRASVRRRRPASAARV